MSIDPLFFLYQEDYGIYSRSIAKHLQSLNASVLLSELAQRRQYHNTRDELVSDERYGEGWFYMTIEKVEDRTSLSRKEQDTAIKILIKSGLIEQKNFGMPGKRHFRLIDEKILEIYGLLKKDYRLSEKVKPQCPKRSNHNVRKGQPTHIYKENEEKIPKKNDNIVTDDRSSFQSCDIVFFDPDTYKFPDGTCISLHMRRSLAKYSEHDMQRLRANVLYFEEQLKKGIQPKKSYEQMLQGYINHNYAQGEKNTWQNKIYAECMKHEHNLIGLSILKTVIKLKKNLKEAPDSISLTLPPQAFTNSLNNYIENYKGKL